VAKIVLGDPRTMPAGELRSAVDAATDLGLPINAHEWATEAAARLQPGTKTAVDPVTAPWDAADMCLALATLSGALRRDQNVNDADIAAAAAVAALPAVLEGAAAVFADVNAGVDASRAVELALRAVSSLSSMGAAIPETTMVIANDLALGAIQLLRLRPLDSADAAGAAARCIGAISSLPSVPLVVGGLADSIRVPIDRPETTFTVLDPLCRPLPPGVSVTANVIGADEAEDEDDEDDTASEAPAGGKTIPTASDSTSARAPVVDIATERLDPSTYKLRIPPEAGGVGAYLVELSVRAHGSSSNISSSDSTKDSSTANIESDADADAAASSSAASQFYLSTRAVEVAVVTPQLVVDKVVVTVS
jgi:hypothetical protein